MVWAVVAEEKEGIGVDVFLGVLDAQGLISLLEIGFGEIFKALGGVVGEDNVFCFRLDIYISIGVMQRWNWIELTRQCAQALVLYKALSLNAQIWQVRWLHGAIELCTTGEAQMKQTSASTSSSSSSSSACAFPLCNSSPSPTVGAAPLVER